MVTVGTLGTFGAPAEVSPDLLAGLQWRNIGPYHGGRVASVAGVIGQPGVFYAGMPAGGIWKTTSAGTTWFPIADQITQVDGFGAIQVAPSAPNIIYAGSGDSVQGSSGDGMYKSTDAGKTWTHVGLEDTTKINKILIDPENPDIVVASTQGDARHTGQGIYRTTDGGKTWQNTLKPENANGTRDLAYAFDMPNLMFATSQGNGGGGGGFGGGGGGGAAAPAPAANGTALFKSTDEGNTWTKVSTLPPYTGRIGIAVAMHTNGQRLYVVGGQMQGSGLYRSDDQGATWKHMDVGDARVSNGQGAYSCGVWVDSQNPDILYTVNTAAYRSVDGGNTFIAFKGAPGGEDMHDIWIDPTNGQRMLFGVDQGAAVTLDGGKTWSSYYALPIDQVYHVTTDSRYPYWVLASQQDTGAIMTRSRSDQGQITEIDWYPLPSSEFGTVVTDPLKPTTVYGVGYGNGQGSDLIKIDLENGQWGNVSPRFGADSNLYTAGRDFWKRFDTAFDPKALYVGYNCLLVTRDGAQTWTAASPDLTTPKGQPMVPCGVAPAAGAGGRGRGAAVAGVASGVVGGVPVPAGAARGAAPARGAGAAPAAAGATPAAPIAPAAGGGRGGGAGSISDFSISTFKQGVIWSGSSTGQIYNTMDGGKIWNNVTNFTDLPANANFVTVEAGHTDVNTAYVLANVGAGRGGGAGAPAAEQHYIYRTHDAGKTWTRIVNGFPGDERTGSQIHVIREDPKQKGLLFAGTETTVFVSFDDGDHWQSLRLNLPSTSIRDMVFHTDDHMNDLVIGTYGRGFYVLDDMSPLRDIAAKSQQIASAPAYLFKPGDAIRARFNSNWDQPLNPELTHAPNPPYGAIIYYHLSQPPKGEIKLQIFDADAKLVRTISSIPPPPVERAAYPDYWLMPPKSRSLSTKVGTNRTNWDLRYDDPPGYNQDLENQMNVAPGQVTPAPHGPLALPGTYTLKLLVDGATYTQTVVVHNDPRVGESPAVLAAIRSQNKLTLSAYQGMKDAAAGNDEVAALRAQVAALTAGSLPPDVAAAATALDAKLATFGGNTGRGGRGGGGGGGGRGGRGGGAAGVTPFTGVNASFNTLVALTQNGIDMAPNKSQIDTYEIACKDYSATVMAWKAMQTQDMVTFNALLTKNGQKAINVTPTALAAPASCTFVPPLPPPVKK
jgi:photosystem II stability/assembly factor-like uncharacterized protein